MRRIMTSLLALLVLGLLVPVGSAAAQTSQRCFPETGQCISGAIRQYWERNGGLPVFGYPTTALQTQTVENWSGPVQWFERDRLEDHSAEGIGVLAGRLGAERLQQQGRPWQYGNEQPAAGCSYFQQTGYNACGGFLSYWQRNGGLERFGYPITGVIRETIGSLSYDVQYFERRRMEYHPENKAPYDVLLGLLGNEVRSNQQSGNCSVAILYELQANYRSFTSDRPLGCPQPGQDYSYTQGAAARFERGQMYWINLRGGKSVIYVVIYGPNGSLTYRVFDDTWKEGDPVNTGLKPPAGLYEPQRGFGKIWREQPGIRDAVGWALETERAVTVSYQVFDQGTMARIADENIVWQFSAGGAARSAQVQY